MSSVLIVLILNYLDYFTIIIKHRFLVKYVNILLLILGGVFIFTGYYTWKRIEQTKQSPFPYVITFQGAQNLEVYANIMFGKLIIIMGAGLLIAGVVLPLPIAPWSQGMTLHPSLRPIYDMYGDVAMVSVFVIFIGFIGNRLIVFLTTISI